LDIKLTREETDLVKAFESYANNYGRRTYELVATRRRLPGRVVAKWMGPR
jgi:hypothetical protein